MKSTAYIKSFINTIVAVFPTIQCSYGFDNLDNTHTIEIIPSDFFNLNKDFEIIENKFYDDFFNLYPNEIVYIITDNSSFPVINPIYTKSGLEFNVTLNKVISYTTSNFVFTENTLNIYSNNQLTFNPLDVTINNGLGEFLDLKDVLLNDLISNAGEANCALAA